MVDTPAIFFTGLLPEPSVAGDCAKAMKGDKIEQPTGMFVYDPKKDAWKEVKSANQVPMDRVGWMPLCYDSQHDCLIGMVGTTFYVFRYAQEE